MAWFFERSSEISPAQLEKLVIKSAEACLENICKKPKRVLLLPPDITRCQCKVPDTSGEGGRLRRVVKFVLR